jgi:hypothetical protein
MIAASVSLFAGSAPAKKADKKPELKECSSQCFPKSRLDCETPWDITASATYWQPRVQAGEIAVLTSDRTQPDYPVGATGVEPNETFAWGFQAGVGYTSPEDHWRISGLYTYYKNVNDTSLETSYGQAFAPSIYANISIQTNPDDSSHQNLFNNLECGTYTLFNDLDILASRPAAVTPNLEITALWGIEAQFLQRRHTNVFSNSTEDYLDSVNHEPYGYISQLGGYYQNYQKYTWWGVGPEVGVHTNWHVGGNFYLFGDGFGSLAYGLSTARTATSSKSLDGNNDSYLEKEAAVQNEMYQFSPAVKYMLGFSWCKDMDSNDSRVSLKIAYQAEYFFYLIKSVVPNAAFRSENGSGIGFQGIVLNAGYDF